MKRFLCQLPQIFAGFLMALLVLAPASSAWSQDASTWARINETKVLRLGVAPYAPFSYKDPIGTAPGGIKQGSDTWRGIAVAMGSNIGEALGVKVEVVELSWASAIAAIQNGQVDLFFGLDGTPTRAAAIEFIHEPVYQYAFVFYGKDEVKADTWADINKPEVTIGLVVGTNFESMVKEYAPNVTVKNFQSNSEILAAFQTGQIDGTITTPASADLARSKMDKGKVSQLNEPAIFLPILAAIPPQGADQRWRDFLETSLQYMSDSGLTRNIYKKELINSGASEDRVNTLFIR